MPHYSPTTDDGGRWRFGVFEFDSRTLELVKGGRVVKVRPQALKLLAVLVSRPGELVSRDELQRRLWDAETFVDYAQGVNHCIKELRAALGDLADSPRFIETLARRGYRFIAPVEPLPPRQTRVDRPTPAPTPFTPPVMPAGVVSPLPERGRRWRAPARGGWLAAVASGLAILGAGSVALLLTRSAAGESPRLSSIAVVPFVTHGSDPALGIGLAYAIARRLGGQRDLAVRAPAQTAMDAVQGANAKDAALVLEGEVAINGTELTVQARLKSPNGARELWSERFRVRADELFSVEDVVAERVVGALGVRLAAAEQERLRKRYTNNTAAYHEYLRGQAALVRYTREATLEAIATFERALQRDPDYALARAGLAMACADMCLRFASAADVDGWAERAESAARAALALDPDLAEAHLARAAVARKREFDWNATVAASRRALLLNPNLDQARFFIAAAYYHLGYMEEAVIEMEKGRALRGNDIVEPTRIEGLVALFGGRYAPALARLEEVSRLSSQPIGDTYLALAAYFSGSTERGRRMLQALATHSSTATAMRSGAILAAVLAAEGDPTAARVQLERVLTGRYRDHHVSYNIGVAHAQLGDMEQAVRWLRTASDTGFPCLPWFEHDPLLEPLRRHPQFAELLKYVRDRRDSTLSTVS